MKRVVVDTEDLVRSTKGTYRVYLSDGRMLVTDELEYADSILVLHNTITEGARSEVSPIKVNLENVDSIEAVRMNWLLTAVVWTPIVAAIAVVGYWIFLDAPDEGFGN
jgi:hypothetical protein